METRNYVQRVMENLQVYRARFQDDAPLTIDADLRRDLRQDLRRDAAAK
jgi:soluble lytic murein transglycosylase